ncbi:Crp/Fnr family transcriptional regulator [Alicyclobacillus cellulosilyticus]|uniref:Crp/Fnr family transcriptional regulator n=1 Tax=Alicyclobacillus cellulosilyticus TaxID=1003997 RepID=A0A917KAJ5_9BACL|nr:Crp/Fnr family transcriptional regulator [Alicyclobacillus cellulosilyticus]GGJ07028.1 Crp/Fnr family transcriptional regulator [Alicyclobacillus cellulosilyticus]
MDGPAALRELELFRDLTEEELRQVYALALERQYGKGDYIFFEGEHREAVYFIRRGLVKVFKVDEEGREHIVSILGRGQMFPHVGFFQDGPYPGTAQAMERSTLLAIPTAKFDALLLAHPDMMRKLMRVMGQKILQLQAKLQELALFDARERVIALLRHFAEEHGEARPDGIHIKLPVTHGEMARMMGMTRESVNRVWNQLRREGLLRGERDEWVVHRALLGKRGEGA